DREFLIQLGRVKDVFSLDKMFFIINAADLASSDKELQMVTDYVRQNLITYGIREPRIYPVSSQIALAGKQRQQTALIKSSGMQRFEAEFTQFSMHELTDIAVQAAHDDMQRIKQTLQTYLDLAQEDSHIREEKRQRVQDRKNQMIQVVQSEDITAEERALIQQ